MQGDGGGGIGNATKGDEIMDETMAGLVETRGVKMNDLDGFGLGKIGNGYK